MVKLEAKETAFGGIFYFHNMKDCEDFLYVFKDHWCNVPWEEPILIPDDENIGSNNRKYMDIPPKERAEDNLSWGFSLVKRLGIDLTKEQSNFIKSFTDNI